MVFCSVALFKLVKMLSYSHSLSLPAACPFILYLLTASCHSKVKFKSSRLCCTNVFGGAFFSLLVLRFLKYLAQVITFPFALLNHAFVAVLNIL